VGLSHAASANMKGTMQIQHRDVVQAGWSARPVAAAAVAQQFQQQRQTNSRNSSSTSRTCVGTIIVVICHVQYWQHYGSFVAVVKHAVVQLQTAAASNLTANRAC